MAQFWFTQLSLRYFFPMVSLMHISKTTRRVTVRKAGSCVPCVCFCTLLCDWMADRFPEVPESDLNMKSKLVDRMIKQLDSIITKYLPWMPEGFSFLVSRWSCDRQRKSRDLSTWSRLHLRHDSGTQATKYRRSVSQLFVGEFVSLELKSNSL